MDTREPMTTVLNIRIKSILEHIEVHKQGLFPSLLFLRLVVMTSEIATEIWASTNECVGQIGKHLHDRNLHGISILFYLA